MDLRKVVLNELEQTSNLDDMNCYWAIHNKSPDEIKDSYWYTGEEPITYPRDLSPYEDESPLLHSFIVIEHKKYMFLFFLRESDVSIDIEVGWHSPFWDEAYD